MRRKKKVSELIVTERGETVVEQAAKTFVEVINAGGTQAEAERQSGYSLAALRKAGRLSGAVRQLLTEMESNRLLDDAVMKKVAKATALELMMQDEDLRVKLGAAKTVLDDGKIGVQNNTQINLGLVTDPEVIEALKSLQIYIDEGDKDADNE